MELIESSIKLATKTGRPRDTRLQLKILQTALALAEKQGYRKVTMQAVAAEARVGRPTIYRWWPNKTMLYLDVIMVESAARRPHPEQPASFKEYLEVTYDMLNGSFGSLCMEVLIDVSSRPTEYGQAYRTSIVDRRKYVQQLLRVFAKQHKSNFSVPIDVVTDMVIGIMWYRLIHKNLPLTKGLANEVYNAVERMLI